MPRHATIVDRQSINSEYDFIIAGGGISGLTLADRLTEDPNGTVHRASDLLVHLEFADFGGCWLL